MEERPPAEGDEADDGGADETNDVAENDDEDDDEDEDADEDDEEAVAFK